MEKEQLKKLIMQFLEETEGSRTEYINDHPREHAPTFVDFIMWIKEI